MSAFIFLAAAVSIDGPDLAAIDRAVAKCDAKVMTATFADEPQRRRAFAVAAFAEQQEIVTARRSLAAKRQPAPPAVTPLPVTAPADDHADVERDARLIGERQAALDDARMLSAMRDQTLDLMRQQYVAKCSVGKP